MWKNIKHFGITLKVLYRTGKRDLKGLIRVDLNCDQCLKNVCTLKLQYFFTMISRIQNNLLRYLRMWTTVSILTINSEDHSIFIVFIADNN